tara:strand:- start:3766 stop:4659 length:894 start_codon:yes stop_codon:yes gene_type:complete
LENIQKKLKKNLINMQNFSNYLKKKIIIKDIFNIKEAEMYKNLFDTYISKSRPIKNKILPYGWHWLYFSDNFPVNEIGSDGHKKRGDFIPSFKGCKRMFAGSEIKFKKEIHFNDKATKVSQIKKIENKSKENKIMYFVIINHIYKVMSKVVLEENQSLVFINQDFKSKKKILLAKDKENLLLYKKNFSFNNIMLFKYSAITYNSHRIHYDLNYAREEGYTDLLVHGPLLATFSLDEFRKNIKYKLTTFKFNMLKPVLVNEKINLKISQNIKNKKEFKAIISCLKSKEIKFVATYLIR